MAKASQRAIDLWAYRHLAGYAIDDVPVTRLSDATGPTFYLRKETDSELRGVPFTADWPATPSNIHIEHVPVTLYRKQQRTGEWVQCLVAWDDEKGLFLSPVAPENIQNWMGVIYTFATQQEQKATC